MSHNPPAFPSVCLGDPGHPSSIPGMTLRDWFAGQALAGMSGITLDDGDMLMGWADMAKAAYNAADAMLAESEKGGAA